MCYLGLRIRLFSLPAASGDYEIDTKSTRLENSEEARASALARDFGGTATEREVLRVLWADSSSHLVRSEIHKRMPLSVRPTLGRIGQILARLYDGGMLERVERRAQGSRRAGFFALSERGRELCRILGFENEEQPLFPVTAELLKRCLTREKLARKLTPQGKIVSVYGYRGGLGRTTLVAHVAKGLAEKFGKSEEILAADLDLDTPGLDDFFESKDLRLCRGLGGLRVDYERKAPRKRSLWLRGALRSSEYVVRPANPWISGLLYLPSGISPGQGVLSPSERAEALALLRAEAASTAPLRQSESDMAANWRKAEAGSFLSELRKALQDSFSRVIVDSQSGQSLGTWIATQGLPDELVVCAEATDESQAILGGLKAVIANFLNRRACSGLPAGISFLFRITATMSAKDLLAWIERCLVVAPQDTIKFSSQFRVEQLPYDLRLAKHLRHWEHTHLYSHVIAFLDARAVSDHARPPEQQVLLDVLDPTKEAFERQLAAGLMENAPLQELARWIDWNYSKGVLPKKTDELGKKLIGDIVQAQIWNRILKSSVKC